jgi:hypothetical protein
MIFKNLFQGVCGVAVFLICGSIAAPAAQMCNSALRNSKVKSGDVVLVGRRGVTVVGDSVSMKAAGSIKIGYVVPERDQVSGALIIKLRHQAVATTSSAKAIQLSRESYISPCTQDQVASYSWAANNQTYVDYHKYGLRDPERNPAINIDTFHADVGPRAGRKCVRTSDSDIRGQFLFSADPDGRRVAGTWEILSRQRTKFVSSGESAAFADPPDFNQFIEYQTAIIPYKKPANKSVCVAFDVASYPNSLRTEIMIVDADDAIALGIVDPQKRRTINWQ